MANSKGKKLIVWENDSDEDTNPKDNLCLLAKVWTTRKFSSFAFMSYMEKKWNISKATEIADNLFRFKFRTWKDKEKVFDGEPWFFDRNVVVVMDPEGVAHPSKAAETMHQAPFWVRVYEPPLKGRNVKNAKAIANFLGSFLKLDEDEGVMWGRFLRIRVLMDLRDPFPNSVEIGLKNGECINLKVKYEQLGNICYQCARLGHLDKDCEMGSTSSGDNEEQKVRIRDGMKATPGAIERGLVSNFESGGGLVPRRGFEITNRGNDADEKVPSVDEVIASMGHVHIKDKKVGEEDVKEVLSDGKGSRREGDDVRSGKRGSSVESTSAADGTTALEAATKTEAEINENRFGKSTSIALTTKPPGAATVGSDTPELTAASSFKTGVSETPITTGSASLTSVLSSQSASSASSTVFGLSGSTGFDASKVGNPYVPAVSTSASKAPETSTMAAPISSSSNATTPGIFGWQPTEFAFGFCAPSVFGASSATSVTGSSSPFLFGSTSSSVFSAPSAMGSAPAASSTAFPSQPSFGISAAQHFTFGSAPPAGYNDQISMAEDSVQAPAPAAPVFGAPLSGPSSFVFGGGAPTPAPTPTPTPTPSMGSPFQFGGQQTQIGSQNTPFQPSGSFELNNGGAGRFSLGSGGVDKSNRRIVRVKNRIRKK